MQSISVAQEELLLETLLEIRQQRPVVPFASTLASYNNKRSENIEQLSNRMKISLMEIGRVTTSSVNLNFSTQVQPPKCSFF